MGLVDGLRKHGFRKWYERELLQSHAHLALAFLCMIGVFAAFEAASRFKSPLDQAVDIAAIGLCMGAGLWALRRYLSLLMGAESAANQADCPGCGTYARFTLVRPVPHTDGALVCCRQCQREWRIDH